MKYDLKKRQFMVREYHKFGSVIKVQRAWRTKYKNLPAPNHNTIRYNVSKFEKYGSIGFTSRCDKIPDQNREQAKIRIKNLVPADPSISIRKLGNATGVSC